MVRHASGRRAGARALAAGRARPPAPGVDRGGAATEGRRGVPSLSAARPREDSKPRAEKPQPHESSQPRAEAIPTDATRRMDEDELAKLHGRDVTREVTQDEIFALRVQSTETRQLDEQRDPRGAPGGAAGGQR